VVIDLAGIRRSAGLTQIELAANMGVGQAHVSKIERQDDMLISTLAAYLGALGANARIVVDVADQTITFDLGVWRRKR
jgi:transcriptional regulator with XRE-family HTH domain